MPCCFIVSNTNEALIMISPRRRGGEMAAVPRMYSPRELHEQTGVPQTTWYTLIAEKKIKAIRIGRSVRVDERDLIAWIDAHRERTA